MPSGSWPAASPVASWSMSSGTGCGRSAGTPRGVRAPATNSGRRRRDGRVDRDRSGTPISALTASSCPAWSRRPPRSRAASPPAARASTSAPRRRRRGAGRHRRSTARRAAGPRAPSACARSAFSPGCLPTADPVGHAAPRSRTLGKQGSRGARPARTSTGPAGPATANTRPRARPPARPWSAARLRVGQPEDPCGSCESASRSNSSPSDRQFDRAGRHQLGHLQQPQPVIFRTLQHPLDRVA